MILHILRNISHLDKNNISLGWQKASISGVSLKPIAKPKHVAGLYH